MSRIERAERGLGPTGDFRVGVFCRYTKMNGCAGGVTTRGECDAEIQLSSEEVGLNADGGFVVG